MDSPGPTARYRAGPRVLGGGPVVEGAPEQHFQDGPLVTCQTRCAGQMVPGTGETSVADDDLVLAMELTDRAAELSLPAFGRPNRPTETKPDGSVVAETDRNVEALLRDLLSDWRPRDHVVGEEYGGTTDAARCWYIDPIDGTANFVRGLDRWSTLVALAVDGVVTVGVIDYPVWKRRVWATRGGGAFAAGRPLHVSTTDRLSEATVCDDYRRRIERAPQ
jgi:histidinol-phosphatase